MFQVPCAPLRGLGRWSTALLLLALGTSLPGCEKTAPPDPQVQRGYQLLESDPQGALQAFETARDPGEAQVILGRGLALENLRRYKEAESVLAEAEGKSNDPLAKLALVRVKIVLGKAEDARPLIDNVVEKVPEDLAALLLETSLAHTEVRSKSALAHLLSWRDRQKGKNASSSPPPAEFYLGLKSLYAQLRERKNYEHAAQKATGTLLSDKGRALALAELSRRAGRRDFAVELLHKLYDDDALGKHRREVALLAHALGAHDLVTDCLKGLTGDAPEMLILRAEHQLITGQMGATVALRKALTMTGEGPQRDRLWSMLIEALLREELAKEKHKETQELLKKFPSQAANLPLARLDLASGMPEMALERLAPLLKTKERTAAMELLAQAHVELKQPDKARELLRELLKDQPAHLRAVQLLLYLEKESPSSAEPSQLIADLITRSPDNVGLHLLLAEARGAAGGRKAAVESLKESISRIKNDPRLRLALVRALDADQQPEAGFEALYLAHKELPQQSMITAALATRTAQAGKAKEAAELYESLLKQAAGDAIALNNLAVLYVDELGDVDRGVELAEEAHRLSQNPGIVDTLGWALFRRNAKGDRERAYKLLASVRDQLSSPTSKYHLAAVLVASKQQVEAKSILQQALAQAGEFPESEQARALLASIP